MPTLKEIQAMGDDDFLAFANGAGSLSRPLHELSDDEFLEVANGAPPAVPTKKGVQPPSPSSTAGGVAKSFGLGLVEGVTTEIPSMTGGAMEFLGSRKPEPTIVPGPLEGVTNLLQLTGLNKAVEDIGRNLKEWAEAKRTQLYGPPKERKGAERIVYEGTKMLAPSILPAATINLGIRILGGVGKLATAAKIAAARGDLARADELMTAANQLAKVANKAASLSVAGLFGLSQAQQTIDTAKERAGAAYVQGDLAGAEAMEARAKGAAPILTGAIEAGGEYLGTKYLGKLFRLDEAGVTKRGAKNLVSDFLKTLGVEVGTEMGQQGGEAAVEKYSGIRPEANPLSEALDVVGPTAFMILLTGGLAGAVNRMRRPGDTIDLMQESAADDQQASDLTEEIRQAIARQELDEAKGKGGFTVDELLRPSTARESAETFFGPEAVHNEIARQKLAQRGLVVPEEIPVKSAEESARVFQDELDQQQARNIQNEYAARPTSYQQPIGPALGLRTQPAEPARLPAERAQAEKAPPPVEAQPGGTLSPPAGLRTETAPTIEEIDQAANEAATSPLNDLPQPTEEQKRAGNYKKGHVTVQGLDISIENPLGSERSGKDQSGKPWSIVMKHPYGYIRETQGKDKDHIDVIIGPNPESQKAFIVDQIDPKTGAFDEHKTLIGFNSEKEARQGYLDNYEDGWKGLGAITEMPMDEFKSWAWSGRKTKPVAYKETENAAPVRSDEGPVLLGKKGDLEEKEPGQGHAGGGETQTVRLGAGKGGKNLQQPEEAGRPAPERLGVKETESKDPWDRDFKPNKRGYHWREVEGLPEGYAVAQWPDHIEIVEKDRGNVDAMVQKDKNGEWMFRPESTTIKVGEAYITHRPTTDRFKTAKEAVLDFAHYKDVIKEPWKHTKLEYMKYFGNPDTHHNSVADAIRRKIEVPAQVLKDYPELQKKAKPSAPQIIIESAPPGGWKESDKVPEKDRRPAEYQPLSGSYKGEEELRTDYPIEAEKEFKKDLKRFAAAINTELGWEPGRDKKGKDISVRTNISPAGGDGSIRFWKPGSDLGIYVNVPVHRDYPGHDLSIPKSYVPGAVIMYRAESRDGNTMVNRWAPADITPQDLAEKIRTEVEFFENRGTQEVIQEAKNAGHTDEEITAAFEEGERIGEAEGTAQSPEETAQTVAAIEYETETEIKSEDKPNLPGKVARTVYTQNYKHLSDLFTKWGLGKPEDLREHKKLKSSGFMDLSVEFLRSEPNGDSVLAMAHYYEQNGDLIPDPDMTVRVSKDGTVEALTFQDYRTYREVYPDGKLNASEKRGQNSFLAVWLKNIAAQGYMPEQEKKAEEPAGLAEPASPAMNIAAKVAQAIINKETITADQLFRWADEAYGGTQAEGKYTPKDAYDAMELGVNKAIEDSWLVLTTREDAESAKRHVRNLKNWLAKIPTQTRRTTETDQFQQFSTPPTIGYVANWVANIQEGETYLEPSAGIGGLAVFGKNAGARVIVNELSSRRRALLSELGFDQVFGENAEQINNILPKDIKPTVIVMNPPFSATAGRRTATSSTVGFQHVEQALKRLQPNGRAVIILGKDITATSAFTKWLKSLGKDYTLQTDIGISGKEYQKYGTTYGNQLIVIDKVQAQEGARPVTADVEKVEDAIDLLKGVRDARVNREPETLEPKSEAVPQPGEGNARPVGPVLPAAGQVGSGKGWTGNRRPGAGQPANPDAAAAQAGNAETGEREPGGSGSLPESPEEQLDTARPGLVGPGSGEGNAGAEPRPEPATRPELELEKPEERTENREELSDSVYEVYHPQKVKISGAKSHPGKLVESAAMSVVEPPEPTYVPNLPAKIIKGGKLSDAQLEAIVYAGQAHSQMLPTGERRGYFIGDGTGVGKGREIAGIIFDNWRQGRQKAVWISQNSPLIEDARRDIKGISWDPNLIIDLSKIKIAATIPKDKNGIVFLGYSLLKMEDRKSTEQAKKEGKQPNSRLKQLVDWFGKDYDGVIVFDEAHNMGNALPVRGKRGMTKPSQTALAGVELQKQLPNARVVYVSATGATEVMNLSYADRLGLWGEGTPFANKSSFVGEISSGGIAAMELVARDMKAMGNYLARSLSYDDVKYEQLNHTLTPQQREIYDEFAGAWQMVLAHINEALETTGGAKSGKGRGAALAQFWGSSQRFFNQVITSMQTPAVVNAIEKDLAKGHAVVLQIVNTNEAATGRALAKMEEGEELEDLDLTPKEQIMEYVRNSFPVTQYQPVEDENGNIKWVPVLDSAGNPVENAEAVEMREELLNKLGSIRGIDGPLEILLDHFGTDKIAEITGRTRRVVYSTDEKGNRVKVIERRSKAKTMADADAFMNDKKPILIFSYAGGTGRSYHADLAAKNQRLRRHYLLQAGWRADRAIQGFGRTHRSSQKQAPEYILVTTDIIGQKRFISSIARRLDQLGALTRGQREAGSGGFFTARDNLESEYAQDALDRMITDIYHHRGIMTMSEFMEQTGLTSLVNQDTGQLNSDAMPSVTQFLNRLLAMNLDKQVEVFEDFSKRLDQNIRAAMERGDLDIGLETLKAKKISKVSEQVVHTDKSGAQTKYVELDVTRDAHLMDFAGTKGKNSEGGYYRNVKSGQVWAASGKRSKTDSKTGTVVEFHQLRGPSRTVHDVSLEGLENPERYVKLTPEDAQELWNKEYEALPKTVTYREHLVTGTVLPIWDRLKGKARIMRVQTDAGERLIGRIIPTADLEATLRNLGASASKIKQTPKDLFHQIRDRGFQAELANGWKIVRRRVSGENRIELIGPEYGHAAELKRHGVFQERIQWNTRYFIPTSEEGIETIKAITANRPVVNTIAPVSVKEGLPPAEQYARRAAQEAQPQTRSRSLIESVFPGQEIKKDGNLFTVTLKNGLTVEIERVPEIIPDEAALRLGYIQGMKKGEYIAGVFIRDPRNPGKPVQIKIIYEADRPTLHHESIHFLESFGIITRREQVLIDRAIKESGQWRQGWSAAENRAGWLANELNAPKPGTFLGRVWQKIRDFIDRMVNAFGVRTVGGIKRDIESGKIFEREPEGAGSAGNRYAVGQRFGAADIPVDDVTPKLLDVKGTNRDIISRAAEEYKSWPEKITAADGSEILLANPEEGYISKRALHLVWDNEKDGIHIEKVKWLPNVPNTLSGAAVRIIDSRSGNRIYVRAYSEGTRHMVVVAPDGKVVEQEAFTGKLVSQFPYAGRGRQDSMRIDWERKKGEGRSQGNPSPTPPVSAVPGPRQEEFHEKDIADTENVKPKEQYSVAEKLKVDKERFKEFKNRMWDESPDQPGMLQRAWDEFIFQAQDRFRFLLKAQIEAERRKSEKLTEEQDAYLAETRYHGMAAAAIDDFEETHIDPLMKVMSDAGLSVEDVDRFLHARHAREANERLKKINPEREDNEALSGMTNEEAVRILTETRTGRNAGAYEQIGEMVDQMTAARRALLVEAGLETPETVARWESTYQHYVPLMREGKSGAMPRRGRGYDIRGGQKIRAGSEREVVNILANLVAQHEAAIIRAEKVKVGRAFLNFAERNKGPWKIDTPEQTATINDEGLIVYRSSPLGFILADNVLAVRVDGQDHHITFDTADEHAMKTVAALKNLDGGDSGAAMRVLSKVSRYLAMVNTALNPEFIISNFARDIQTAAYNMSDSEADKIRMKAIKQIPKAFQGIRDFQKDQRGTEWAKWFDQFRHAGGQTGWVQSYGDIKEREKALIEKIRRMEPGKTWLVRRGLEATLDYISDVNIAVENAVRLSVFKNLVETGVSEGQAARIAKELTVNFNRRGNLGPVLNTLYLFFNASMQGSARIIQAAAKSRKVRKLMTGTVVFAALLDMANRMIGGDDPDDGEALYDKIPEFEKERNLIIMLGSENGYVKIPLPWGYNVFHVLGQAAGEVLTKENNKVTKSAMRVLGATLAAFNPMGSESSLLQMISPTLTDPLVQWAENKDWSGRKLRPSPMPGAEKPASQTYWKSVREPSRWIAETLNELTGGDEVRPGKIDVSPEAIDLAIDTFTGGTGKFISNLISTPVKAVKGDDIETFEIPFLRRLYGKPGKQVLTQEFYENMDEIRLVNRQVNHYRNDPDKLKEIAQEHKPELRLIERMKATASALKDLRDLRQQAEKIVDPEKKKDRLDMIEDRMETVMKGFNAAYHRIMKKGTEK